MAGEGPRTLSPRAIDALSGTLYAAPGPLVTGSGVLCAAAWLVADRTQGAIPLAGLVALCVIGALRIGLLLAYRGAPIPARTGPAMVVWRRMYALGILVCSTTVGALTAACLLLFDDPVSHMILVATAVGYASGVAGRNAACLEVSLPQLWGALLPTVFGLALHGDLPYLILGVLVLVFAVGMTQIGFSINRSLVDAYRSAQEREAMADRFDAALATMQHGFCLFDRNGLLVACSESFGQLLRIPVPPTGTGTEGIGQACSDAGVRIASGGSFHDVFSGLLAARLPTSREVALADGRTLGLTASPKVDGGCVVVCEDVTARVTAARDLARMALNDPLTGLLNRAASGDALEHWLAAGEPVAVHLIDLDRFKGVNDAFGHACGDGLLRGVAERVRALLPEGAVAARLGGDEFVIVQPLAAGDPAVLAGAVIRTLETPFDVEGRELSISASVGFAMSPRDGTGAGELMRNADTALYRAKSAGRRGWKAFNPAMDAEAQARRALESDLREAVAAGVFDIVYQPQMTLATGACLTCEALVRWNHPVRGSVQPSEFIPIAEETGMIHGLGRIVLERACREAAGWEGTTTVAVNISPVQFRNDLPGMVAEVLRATGLPASRLELEVTESVFLESREEVTAAFDRLAAMGVRISLDDFGTGYSSLGYLRAFPFRKVKVDRSFVSGVEAEGDGRAILRAVIGLGADLGMDVVAEGVETRLQLEVLRLLGCAAIQGYYVSRPLDGPAMAEWAGTHPCPDGFADLEIAE